MSSKNYCIHRNKCPIYKGETISEENKLIIHKNVFCQRGHKGWRNCNDYLIFENTSCSSEKQEK